ncbi:hypothetical protein [Cyanobium sp. Lug-B]|uniref:hypothetical protein n=1 Tax=Cyanobium sp. Lug-B TaxID=2823716 RepID=UPI0020CC3BE7|nr:hypothetical protein [Cyanobium sp. Lug-B]MCP9798909.1 hypothetical protein [Cyanobium sp. Lug-B]
MPEQDPRHHRLAVLRQRLEALGIEVSSHPVGSSERDALAVRYGELLGKVLALAEELETS